MKKLTKTETSELEAVAPGKPKSRLLRRFPMMRSILLTFQKCGTGPERSGMFYRPIKRQLTLRIDADIVEWFKERALDGKGYQTSINRALREYVDRHAKQD